MVISCCEKNYPVTYWRTSTGLEVDLIVGNLDLAIEFKASDKIKPRDIQGLKALQEDQTVKRAILVCLIKQPRQLDKNILALSWQEFCQRLWVGEII